MPLQKSRGNMYDWVTDMWNCMLGECPHACKYCYMKTSPRLQNLSMYQGPQRFNMRDANINLGKGRTIFVAHTNDLFTAPEWEVRKVLELCLKYPENEYVFQTKDPLGAMRKYALFIPKGGLFGTTIESDVHYPDISKADTPIMRLAGIMLARQLGFKTFITIEPILKIKDVVGFATMLRYADPEFINIGADSKGCGLPEPTAETIDHLLREFKARDLWVRKKGNLGRLLAL